ncbi:MAG: biotin-dependent carboxyltransferase family protein [Cyclobacteriaceae bacterium]
MKPSVEILSPGLYTSIQDRGRVGYRKFGVPTSGAMDRLSAGMANRLLNNQIDDPVMEITLSGPKLRFSAKALIAIAGADLSPQLNHQSINTGTAYHVAAGDVISFGEAKLGARCYLAVKGGFLAKSILNSASFYKAITGKDRFQKGDKIPIPEYEHDTASSNASLRTEKDLFTTREIECTPGPEFEMLNHQDSEKIFSQEFAIAPDNNRMGYRLLSEPLQYPSDFSMLTSAVLPGTIQLTPSGQLLALMQDCQTTGGYPRILQLTFRGINCLAQKRSGDRFQFVPI